MRSKRLTPDEIADRDMWNALLISKGQKPQSHAAMSGCLVRNSPATPSLNRARIGSLAVVEMPVERRGIGYHMGKNIAVAEGLFVEATKRLRAIGCTPAATALAVQTLGVIVGSIPYEGFRASANGNSIARDLGLKSGRIATVLAELEKAGLIVRVPEGRAKAILVDPRFAYRGRDLAIDALVAEFDGIAGQTKGDA